MHLDGFKIHGGYWIGVVPVVQYSTVDKQSHKVFSKASIRADTTHTIHSNIFQE